MQPRGTTAPRPLPAYLRETMAAIIVACICGHLGIRKSSAGYQDVEKERAVTLSSRGSQYSAPDLPWIWTRLEAAVQLVRLIDSIILLRRVRLLRAFSSSKGASLLADQGL